MADEKVVDTLAEQVEKNIEVSGGTGDKKLSYEATVTLPSKGILYKSEDIPSEISLRGMTTKEEKILYASSGGDVFKKILKNCVTSPENLDVNKLTADDEGFLIMQLRMITYGDKYKVSVPCPHCGKREEYIINLSDFEVNYLDDNFEEPFTVKLPRSGDTLSLRLLRNEDVDFIDRYSRKFAKQFNLNVKEVEYICRMAKFIQQINGKPVDFIDAREYADNMPSMDSAKFWNVINSIKYGLDTKVEVFCANCTREFEFQMPLTSEFFRPTIE